MGRRPRNFVLTLVTFFVLAVAATVMLNWLSKPPSNLGAHAGQLAPCPDSPNCVASQATGPSQQMPAIRFSGSGQHAIATLKKVVDTMPRSKLVTEEAHYLHFEFRSLVLRFVDDVEFLIDEQNSTIHFRSASRIGYSDLGVNRRRMEQVRSRFLAATDQNDPRPSS